VRGMRRHGLVVVFKLLACVQALKCDILQGDGVAYPRLALDGDHVLISSQ
jgi:hypothetical protein